MGMMSLAQAAKVLNAQLLGQSAEAFLAVSTDTRNIKAGDLFVALKGPNFDGHNFIAQARSQGAVAVVVDHPLEDELPQLVVSDTRLALGRLAAAWRDQFEGVVIGVTGSNGKTTVKEMLASILSCSGKVLATEGNLNNDIGVPLMLLRLQPGVHQFAVIEMGANHMGEIAYLSNLVRPDVAAITNAAAAHLAGFGSVEDVARAKGEIWQGLKPSGVAVINADDTYAEYWRELTTDYSVMSFGLVPDADVCLGDNGVQWTVEDAGFKNRFVIKTATGSVNVAMALPGRHNVMNALAATTMALAAKASLQDVEQGLNTMHPVKGRLNPRLASSGQLIIDDTYNANPQSLKAAIDVLTQAPGETVLVIGDMAELGAEADSLHAEVGAEARKKGVSRLYATGPHSRQAVQSFGEGGAWFETQQELIDVLGRVLKQSESKQAVVLVKGSRSARMERVVDALAA